MKADRNGLVLPGKRRVRHNNGHLGKIHGYVINGHGVAILQAHPAAAWHSRTQATMPGVKDDRQPRLSKDFVKRVSKQIIGNKFLDRWMKFESSYLTRRDQALRFLHTLCPAVWVDARKRDGNIGILLGELHHFVV